MQTILISSRSFSRDTNNLPLDKDLLWVYTPKGKKLNETELLKYTNKDIIGIVAGTEQITKTIIDACPNLKVISRYGGGLDNIDTAYAKKKKIKVYSTTSQSTAVAEFTVALMFSLLRKIPQMYGYCWNQMMGNLLAGKTIGIIGFGHIGSKVVDMLDNFNVRFLIYDPRYKFDTLHEVLTKSDIITLHVPLTAKTEHMISKEQFAKMKPTALLINTSRGKVVDERALVKAITKKEIAGAALDVYEKEPCGWRLMELDNVITMPHIASYTYETRQQMEKETIDNLIEGLK
jgi:D-3-phosphoglycerate dehydrogenase